MKAMHDTQGWLAAKTIAWFLCWFAAFPVAWAMFDWRAAGLCWLCSGGAWNFRSAHNAFEATFGRRVEP